MVRVHHHQLAYQYVIYQISIKAHDYLIILLLFAGYGQIRDLIMAESADEVNLFPAINFLLTCVLIFVNFFLHFFTEAKPAYVGPRYGTTHTITISFVLKLMIF